MNTKLSCIRILLVLLFFLSYCQTSIVWAVEDYSHFAELPIAQKEKIVRDLFDTNQFGKPEHKPACRYILEEATHKQDMYAGSGAYGHASSAIALVESQNWKDLSGLIKIIYEKPQSINWHEESFRCLRTFAGNPVATSVRKAMQTLREAGYPQSRVTDQELVNAQQVLLKESDKETVLVYALYVAAQFSGKSNLKRGRSEAADILKTLDQDVVKARLYVFRDNFFGTEHSQIDWVISYLNLQPKQDG